MISQLAYVDPDAKLGKDVTVHPFAFIDKNVEIGDNCEIMPYASLMSGTRMGNNNRVFNGAVIAAEPQDFWYKKGVDTIVRIGNNNDIRENVVINRATTPEGATIIGNDNYIHEGVHISHDTEIGNQCVIGYGCKISGKCMTEDHVIFGGSVLVSQGCRIGTYVMIQTGCRIRRDVPPYIVAAKEPASYDGVNDKIMTYDGFDEKTIKHIAHSYRIIFQGNGDLLELTKFVKFQVEMSPEIDHLISFINETRLGII